MSDGHRTSTIARPRDPTRARPTPVDATSFGDLTRPIPRDKQLVKGRGKRLLITGAALVVLAAFVAALFVLPVQAWLGQRDDIAVKQRELQVLTQANTELNQEVRRLTTPEGVREAAREEIGYVEAGEIRLTVLPAPAAPIVLPAEWPYTAVAQIISVRAGATTAVATPAP